MSATNIANPYVGPRPFERDDRAFFGREREVAELVSLIVAHRVVVLHAASGAGKTSLINAGLLQVLERDDAFEVLPVARLRPFDVRRTSSCGGNVYTLGVASNWRRELNSAGEDPVHVSELSSVLAEHRHITDEHGLRSPRLVVIDQFEELFSLFPERWPERAEFLAQVGRALEKDPLLRVVFSLRDDYLAELDAHAALLPGNLRARLRIERLGPQAAHEAITRPLIGTGRNFAPGVAEKLVSDLRTVRVDGPIAHAMDTVNVVGPFVEPVHLQVACQSLWSDLPKEVATITEVHLRTFGSVDEALARLYDDAARDAARVAASSEGRIRRGLEASFLTAGGTRAIVYRGPTSTGPISNRAIDELARCHLIRAEWRAGARWYELTHDRLIEPLRASNRAFASAASRRRNKRILAASIAAAVLGTASVGILVTRLTDVPTASTSPPSPTHLDGFRVTLPMNWQVRQLDVPVKITSRLSRRRTVATDRSQGGTLIIDAVTGAALGPEVRRDQLNRKYRNDAEKIDYQLDGKSLAQFGSTQAYELRSSYEASEEPVVRNLALVLNVGSHQFEVRVFGRADYSHLATLARRTAASIEVDDTPQARVQSLGEIPSAPAATKLSGYRVDIPKGWRLQIRDEREPSPAGVVRRRTVAVSRSLGLTLLIDALRGYEVGPAENLAILARRFPQDADKPQYKEVDRRRYRVGGVTAHELRYRFQPYGGRQVRNVDLMFKRGDLLFAVLVATRRRVAYSELSTVARRTAASISTTTARNYG